MNASRAPRADPHARLAGGRAHESNTGHRHAHIREDWSKPAWRRGTCYSRSDPDVIASARYLHTNLIARDWRVLACFYESVFGCEIVPPVRDFAAHQVEAGTGVPGAALSGLHLRLPGHGPDGPTIEIFTYSEQLSPSVTASNRPGFGHIAFAVRSVADARSQVLAAGGKPIGEIVTITTATGTKITWCYVTDPEGNIIELQAQVQDPRGVTI
jgi:glyoxylase I family protein